MDLSTPAGRKTLGTRIQSAIMAAGFGSLPQFARRLGCSRALIYQYANGTVLVQLDRLQQIAEHTGKTLAWLLDLDSGDDAARVAQLEAELGATAAEAGRLRDALTAERAERLGEAQRNAETELALLADHCRALRRAGDAPALVEAAARWLELARRTGDRLAELQARLQMGHAWFLQGQLGRAGEVLGEAVQAAVELGLASLEYSARQELVRVLLQTGQVSAAGREAEALAGADQWWPRWAGRLLLAAIAAQSGELADSARHLDLAADAIASGDETPARRAVARTYLASNRVTLALVAGDYATAAALNDELRSLAGQAGLADQSREAELNHAIIALRQGRIGLAENTVRLLSDWSSLAQDARLGALAMTLRSELARRCGLHEQARELGREALDRATAAGQPHLVLEAHLALAEADLGDHRPADATYHLRRALKLAREQRMVRLELQAEVLLATAAREQATESECPWTELLPRLWESGVRDLRVDALVTRAGGPAPDAGVVDLQAAVDAAQTSGYFWGAEAALRSLAEAHLAAGHHAGAWEALAQARQLGAERLGEASCPALATAWDDLERRLGDQPEPME